MGKKDKSKFKKQIKAQLLQNVSQAQSQIQSPQKDKITLTNTTSAVAVKPNTNSVAIDSGFNLSQVKYDLKKTSIVVLVLAIALGVLYYLDLKNNILIQFGDWLFKVLNIK